MGSIIARVVADGRAARDPFDGLTRIGLDEISYKRGHPYLTVCVDHDSGRLVWAAPGKDKKTLNAFFDLAGEERCQKIALVSTDGATWIADEIFCGVAADVGKRTRCENLLSLPFFWEPSRRRRWW